MKIVKTNINTIIIITLLLLFSINVFSYDFEVDGIYYNKLSNNEVEVTYKSYSDKGYVGSIAIPKDVVYEGKIYNVVAIGKQAFLICDQLLSISIPNCVKEIGYQSFAGCVQISDIILPNEIETIKEYAFNGCSKIRKIYIPKSLKNLNHSAFWMCNGIEEIVVDKENAIYDSRDNCNAIINTANNRLMNGCKKTIIPNTVISIGQGAFVGCTGLSSIIIPNSVIIINGNAFSEAGLTTIEIPENVTYIGQDAFAGCKNLSSVTIPSTVTSLIDGAFYGCSKLHQVISKINTPFNIKESVFSSISKDAILIVPKGCSGSYLSYSGWKNNFKTIIEEGETLFTLSIQSIGNGSASYDGTTIRSKTSTFTVNEGTNATISFSADNGYRIKSVKVNNTNVTSSVSNNQYTVRNIQSNTTVEVEFEAVSSTTHNLSISATGNGKIVCPDNVEVRNETKVFPFEEGVEFNFQVIADEGFTYTLSTTVAQAGGGSMGGGVNWKIYGIKKDASVTVTFKEYTKHNLTISSKGNGYVLFDGKTIRNETSSFTLYKGTSETISFSPDNGYRLKSVKVNNSNVTSSVSNNQYTVSNIQANTTVEVEFEAIPVTTYTLSISSTGSGYASYDGTTIRSKTSTFTVNEGTNATISFSADNGYRIKSVKVNSTNVTSSVSNNQYTVSNIQRNTTVEVEFEAIPPTTYTLSISSTGSGYASYDGTTIRSKTSTFTVNEGTNATISFSADNGYRIKSVKVNSTNVTSSVSNNQYTVSNIQSNTTVEVEFEAIPVTTYTLSIKATGNGSASYDGNTIRGKTSSFSVNEGTSVTITFNPDNGYRIKSVKEDGTDVTSYVSNGTYSIKVISKNTSLEVEFEAIPPTTYTLSISSTGYGTASYDGSIIRNRTSTFTVYEGSNATISFGMDSGYRIKIVKVNSSDVTSSVSNNQYTVRNIQSNITVEVEFEAIPPTTYYLSISSTGNGYASYDGTIIRSKTSTFSVNVGTNATIKFNADNGYRIKSVKVNSSDVTSSVSNNQYTISYIQRNTTVEVEFEAIPSTTYTLSISSAGNGYASYDGTTIRSKTSTFTVNEGTNATISFSPDNGYMIKSVKINSTDVTSNLSNNKYTISNINKNTSVEVEFQEELKTFTSGNLNYAVLSYDDKTVNLANGKYGTVLEVPATITYQDITWKVAGIDNAALANNEELAAIIWNPSAAFTVSVSNPNLLLYVKSANYAPATIQNVVVNSTAESIVLTDAASGNNFYCPKEFTAKKISYTHNYGMITGLGESRGWETIALPFDVKKIAHSSKGELTPFANWRSGDSKKPFWLMSYGTGGWTNASSIKANTPYIISMPNNPDYKAEFRLSGNITFSAENVTVKKSDNLQTGNYGGNTFTPNFSNTDNSGFLALNVNNDYVSYSGGSAEGSTFVVNLRPVHPFEAYMTSTSKTRSTISINGDMATGIEDITQVLIDENKGLRIYNLKGQLIKVEQDKSLEEVRRSLPAGVYIVNGKKLIIK